MKNVIILDSTLREGEQSRGVCFSVKEKFYLHRGFVILAWVLLRLVSQNFNLEADACIEICNSVSDVDLLVHARANRDDILAARKNLC